MTDKDSRYGPCAGCGETINSDDACFCNQCNNPFCLDCFDDFKDSAKGKVCGDLCAQEVYAESGGG